MSLERPLRWLPGAFVALALGAGCAPKTGGGGGDATPTPAPTATATPIPTPDPKLVELGIGGARALWNDPPIRAGERVRWVVTAADFPERILEVSRSESSWTLLAGHPSSASRRTFELPVAAVASNGEAAFTAAGGTFLGNEVLRVPAGEFRARHALIAASGKSWHLYLVRTVPGGVAKVEAFTEGAMDPVMVMELDDFTRVKPAP